VVVERRKANSPWADFIWRAIAVLGGVPDTKPWTILTDDADIATFYAGAADVALYRSETEHYRRNLASEAPSIWVALYPSGGEPPFRVASVTADPAEGEGWTEPGDAIVDAVSMPAPLQDAIAGFVAEHHVEHVFAKRERDRADPEALARRGKLSGHDDER